jgi:hypothetical protein
VISTVISTVISRVIYKNTCGTDAAATLHTITRKPLSSPCIYRVHILTLKLHDGQDFTDLRHAGLRLEWHCCSYFYPLSVTTIIPPRLDRLRATILLFSASILIMSLWLRSFMESWSSHYLFRVRRQSSLPQYSSALPGPIALMDIPNCSVNIAPLTVNSHEPVLGQMKAALTRLLLLSFQSFSFPGCERGQCSMSYSPLFAALEYPMIE